MDTGEQVIRLLIADDHRIVRMGFEILFEDVTEVEIVGAASDGVEAVELAQRTQPDVILLDLAMPRKTGIEAIPDIKKVSPHSHILILTSYADDDMVFAAIKAGAIGYLLKETSTETLREAIRLAHQGIATLAPPIARKLIRELNRPTTLPPSDEPLTEREAEVLILVARNLAVAEIADKLRISEEIVHRHVTNVLAKFRKGSGPGRPLDPPLPLPMPVR